jgi:hypothetical protein
MMRDRSTTIPIADPESAIVWTFVGEPGSATMYCDG